MKQSYKESVLAHWSLPLKGNIFSQIKQAFHKSCQIKLLWSQNTIFDLCLSGNPSINTDLLFEKN